MSCLSHRPCSGTDCCRIAVIPRNPAAPQPSVTTNAFTISERVLGHPKINRAIATRYGQLAESFVGMLFLALTHYCIKFGHAS